MGKFIILIFFILFASTITNAQKYEAVIFSGNLPLKIDGDLSDWKKDWVSKTKLATSHQGKNSGQQIA